jgi:protein required for attachment to host cells
MSRTRVVVADSARGRILTLEHHTLTEIADVVHPASRRTDHDLVSDRQGRTFDSSRTGARHAMEPQHSPQQLEADAFARQLAEVLDKARVAGEFDELVLIAAPQFLGLLTAHLDAATKQLISRRIDKNLVRHELDDIARALELGA